MKSLAAHGRAAGTAQCLLHRVQLCALRPHPAAAAPRDPGVPPRPWGPALPSWQPGRVDKASVCPSACVGTAAQKCTSRAASGSAGLREPRALLPCAARAGRGCPTSEVAGTGLGAACLAGACWLRHRHQLFQFPPGNCFCQYFNFIWAAQAEAEAAHPKQIVCHPPGSRWRLGTGMMSVAQG